MPHTSLLSSLTTAEARDDWHTLNTDLDFRKEVLLACRELVDAAYGRRDEMALWDLHEILAQIYDHDFGPPGVDRADTETQPIHRDIAAVLEKAVLERELADITDDELSSYPEDPDAYVAWLKARIGEHASRRHPLYREFMRNEADAEEFRFFLAQESNLDPRFDDIFALMQLGVSGPQKLELAANYRDEMGNGDPADVHTVMFAQALRTVSADDAYIAKNQLLETRISGNFCACLALSRRHYLKAVGFMGVTEYLVPMRFRDFVDGWRRAGLPEAGVRYPELHIGIDAQHASGWFKNVVKPLIREDPRSGREIATGALIRLNSSQRYLDAVLAHFRTATESQD
ncbi:MAG TPA: iron-containing redox enzyme family protein [Streptomyces sp.]